MALPVPGGSAASVDTFVLAAYDFDSGPTPPDPQGWTGVALTGPFGDFAALYPGVSLVQEDPCRFMPSFVWGFFDDPIITNYACGGWPSQGAVQFGPAPGTNLTYLANEIWSPEIPNSGFGNQFVLEFDVYRDLPLGNVVFYTLAVRSKVCGSFGGWRDMGEVYYGGGKDWFRHATDIGSLVDPSATHMQIALGVVDYCALWCNIVGTGTCHSHAPLFDNVRLLRLDKSGPQWHVDDYKLFQDNFADDGTLTGTARADAAINILPFSSPAILPGDSVVITVSPVGANTLGGLGGPAVYAYVAVQPFGQAGKSPSDMEASEVRGGSKRYPLVGTTTVGGVTWAQFRMDSVITTAGGLVQDRYCIDLNDTVFTPGDTVHYFFCADASGATYFSRTLSGQGANFVTADIGKAFASPMEFTILPAGGYNRGGDILYVDDADDRGGPPQLFFDTAFQQMSLLDKVDRYDVLGPSSVVGNSLASRVQNVATQIIGPYQKIIWNSGNLSSGLMGDGGTNNGGGGAEKSDDFALAFQFLHTHPNHPGFYYSADDAASDWALNLTGAAAVNTRSIYMNFNLDPAAPGGDHKNAGEPMSPILDGVGAIGTDQIVAYGGCALINDFDLLTATGLSVAEYQNLATGKTYVLSQVTPNAALSTARCVLSGYSFGVVRNVGTPAGLLARSTHLRNILEFLQNVIDVPVGFDDAPQFANVLKPNYPNPFNPTTTIGYEIKDQGHVSLKIYNAAGQLVRTLVNEIQTPQVEGFSVTWDGKNNAGSSAATGVYFYRLRAGTFTQTEKMVLLR